MSSRLNSIVTRGILATNATQLVQVAISAVTGKAKGIADTVGSNLPGVVPKEARFSLGSMFF